MHIHVLMLCRNFELIPIKIGFFMNFQSCSKIGPNTLYYSTWSWAKFCQKLLEENSQFLLHFLIHIHLLMFCRNFELIPIKIGFFMNFQSCSKIKPNTLYYIVHGLGPNFVKNGWERILNFYYIF